VFAGSHRHRPGTSQPRVPLEVGGEKRLLDPAESELLPLLQSGA